MNAHEHFCSRCYPRRAQKGKPAGWWRCVDKKCVLPMNADCKKHAALRTGNKP